MKSRIAKSYYGLPERKSSKAYRTMDRQRDSGMPRIHIRVRKEHTCLSRRVSTPVPWVSDQRPLERMLKHYESDKENADKRLREVDSAYSRLVKSNFEPEDFLNIEYSDVQAHMTKITRNRVFAKRLSAKASIY